MLRFFFKPLTGQFKFEHIHTFSFLPFFPIKPFIFCQSNFRAPLALVFCTLRGDNVSDWNYYQQRGAVDRLSQPIFHRTGSIHNRLDWKSHDLSPPLCTRDGVCTLRLERSVGREPSTGREEGKKKKTCLRAGCRRQRLQLGDSFFKEKRLGITEETIVRWAQCLDNERHHADREGPGGTWKSKGWFISLFFSSIFSSADEGPPLVDAARHYSPWVRCTMFSGKNDVVASGQIFPHTALIPKWKFDKLE